MIEACASITILTKKNDITGLQNVMHLLSLSSTLDCYMEMLGHSGMEIKYIWFVLGGWLNIGPRKVCT